MTQPPQASPAKPKTKLRWFQFSLRRLLAVMLLVGGGLGWLIHDVRERESVVKMIEQNGGIVYFGEPNSLGRLGVVRSLFGEHAFAPITQLMLGLGTTNAHLMQLKKLKKLESLSLLYTDVTELSPLAGLSGLTTLDLQFSQVDDLSPLAALQKLEAIYLQKDQEVRIPDSLKKVVRRFR